MEISEFMKLFVLTIVCLLVIIINVTNQEVAFCYVNISDLKNVVVIGICDLVRLTGVSWLIPNSSTNLIREFFLRQRKRGVCGCRMKNERRVV